MRALLQASPHLPPAVLAARAHGDRAVAQALLEIGLECADIKELLDRQECPTDDAE